MDLSKIIVPTKIRTSNDMPNIPDIETIDKVALPTIVYYDSANKRRVPFFRATDYAIITGIPNLHTIKIDDGVFEVPTLMRKGGTDNKSLMTRFNGELVVTCDKSEYKGLIPMISVDINQLSEANPNIKIEEHRAVDSNNKTINLNYYTIKLGEFPNGYVGDNSNAILERMYQDNQLDKTGKKYIGGLDKDGNIIYNQEYQLGGDKWVRTRLADNKKDNEQDLQGLSTWCNVDIKPYYWCKVKPIEWIITNWDKLPKAINVTGDGSSNVLELTTSKAILSGLPFSSCKDENAKFTNLWQNSFIRAYLNGTIVNKKGESTGDENFFVPNGIVDFRNKSNFLSEAFDIELTNSIINNSNKCKKPNPYNFQFTDMNNDQLLQAYVASGTSVFLHGPSGVGKSERVKQIDPTATRITLRPQMNPEEIDGTLDRTTGDYIQPLWYKQLCEKCKAEPDRQHVLFIDELTNVKPTVQSLVYSIVLDHAGKDGLWPLPDNSVVVAAGNESADNLAAYPMTNALYRRFCHITYNVDKQNWLNWACGEDSIQPATTTTEETNETKQRIHPSIVAYMMSRKEDILYQELDEEKPSIVVDPRKWEVASDVLYATHNPNSLKPAIGEELTTDFADFVSKINLSVDDVVNGKYIKEEFENKNISEKLATMAGLTNATEENLTTVRQFIRDNLGKEILSNYDLIWTNNDPDRALAVADSDKELVKIDADMAAEEKEK